MGYENNSDMATSKNRKTDTPTPPSLSPATIDGKNVVIKIEILDRVIIFVSILMAILGQFLRACMLSWVLMRELMMENFATKVKSMF